MTILLKVGLIKKTLSKKSEYFLQERRLVGNVKFELDSSNYATKADLKNAAGVYASKFAEKVDLATLKSKTDKLNIDKLENTPVDLRKLSDVIKNEVVQKTCMTNCL